ncbi:putative Ig domain-containing protein [Candidatus Sumerlaeota bacterium]|nr:putative Ig domain-containing protein [Candidatus Sumerlaeota bacterium]
MAPSSPPGDANDNIVSVEIDPTFFFTGGTIRIDPDTGEITVTTIASTLPGTYTARVTATDACDLVTVRSLDITVQSAREVSTPTGLISLAGADSILLRWELNPEPHLLGYNVYRDSSPDGAFTTKLNSLPVPIPEYIDRDVTPGDTFCYKITAISSIEAESPKSESTCAVGSLITAFLRDMRAPAGESVRLRVGLDNASGVAENSAMTVRVGYDPAILTPTAVEKTFLTQGFLFIDNIAGTPDGVVNITGISTTGATISGEGRILDILFDVAPGLDEGTTDTLTFVNLVLFDSGANALTLDFSDTALFSVAVSAILGDINADGVVDGGDALLALLIATGEREATELEITAGDVNGDGVIDSADVTLILRLSVGLPINPGAGSAILARARGTTSDSYNISITQDTTGVEVGGQVTLSIATDNAQMIAGVDIVITFDPAVLTLEDLSIEGTLTSDKFLLNSNEEEGALTISLSAVEGLTEVSGDLVTIEFSVDSGEGTKTPVNIGFIKLSGEFGENLSWDNEVTKDGTELTIEKAAGAGSVWHLYE